MPFIYVCFGGALGALIRFIISKVYISSNLFTYVMLVNIIGCFIAGIAAGYFDKHIESENLRLFIITGILGGFTTFSAFSLDALNMLNKGKGLEAIIYISISVLGSIIAAFAGYKIIN